MEIYFSLFYSKLIFEIRNLNHIMTQLKRAFVYNKLLFNVKIINLDLKMI